MATHDEYFVERNTEISKLDKEWAEHRIFGIYGLRAIGKSCFVAQFLKTRGFASIMCECSTIPTQGSLCSLLCSKLGIIPGKIVPESDAWIEHICEALQDQESDITVVFDNAEDTIEGPAGDTFLHLCDAIVEHCTNVQVIITSTTRVLFPRHSQVYFSLELPPLGPKESFELFTVAAPGVALGSYADALIELCEGLPLLILLTAAELQADGGFIAPADMVQLLLECRLETVSNSLFYPKGGMDSEARTKAFTLRPIRVRHVLNYDSNEQRFNIQGILREVIRANFVIKNLEEIRFRYSKLFSRVMKDIAHRMGTCEYTKAIADFALEQPNLRKLLHEVHHTKQENYKFFIEMASECTDLIEQFMAEESDNFYDGCLRLADMYGEVKDKATVHVAVGSMETLTKKSLNISQLGGHAYESLTVENLSGMGTAFVVLGEFDTAEKYHYCSLKRSEKLQ
ncbi:hypothetical protein MAR_025460, partial [Mya arenaria]